MNIYIAITGPVGKALKKVLDTTTGFCTFTEQQSNAVLVFVDSRRQLMELYNREQFFIVYSMEVVSDLPENSESVSVTNSLAKLLTLLVERSKKGDDAQRETHEEWFPRADENMPATCILVVDDNAENRERAREQLVSTPLPYNYELRIVGSYADAMHFIWEEDWDVVLTDLYLPVSTFHKALSVEGMQVGQLVPYGFLIALEAAQRGAHVGVVTDANHHKDCLSAAFDDLRESFEVGDGRVQFFNNIGKDWKTALTVVQKDLPPDLTVPQ